MSVWAQTLIAVVAVGAASLVGAVFLGRRQDRLDTILMYLVSLSAGVLVGGAVLHLLPQAFANQNGPLETPLYFLGGFLGFFFLERYLWRSHHDHSHFPHPRSGGPGMADHVPHEEHIHGHGAPAPRRTEPAAAMAIVGGGFHNFIDGAVIAASFALDPRLGWITTGAVLLHEIPREFGDFGILVHSGIPPRKALWLNALSGLGALAGAVLVMAIGTRADGLANALVAITAGNFVYIAAANLIPEIHHHHPRAESFGHALVLLLGVAIMLILALAEPLLSAG